MLKVVLIVTRNHLLVYGLREVSLVFLFPPQFLFLARVGVLQGDDVLVLDELERVLQVAEAVLDVEGLKCGSF